MRVAGGSGSVLTHSLILTTFVIVGHVCRDQSTNQTNGLRVFLGMRTKARNSMGGVITVLGGPGSAIGLSRRRRQVCRETLSVIRDLRNTRRN